MESLRQLAMDSAQFAEDARQELAGESLTDQEMGQIVTFGENFANFEEQMRKPGETVALVTDVARDAQHGTVLQEAIGDVDLIYVVISGPDHKLYLACGGVFSYYEFINDINQRLTDNE